MLKKYISFIILTFVSISNPQTSSFVVAEEALHFGAILPLTGNFATYGESIKAGLESGIIELKKKNIDLVIHYEDVPLPNAQAVTAINKLVSNYNVKAIVANFWNPVIPMILPQLKRYQLPIFHTAIADDIILASGSSVYSLMGRVRDEAKILAEFCINKLTAKKIAVMSVQTNWGESYITNFENSVNQLNLSLDQKVVITFNDRIPVSEFDIKTQLQKLRATNPEIIFLAFFGPQLATIINQIREVGITARIVSTYEAQDKSVIDVSGKNLKGVFFTKIKDSEINADTSLKLKELLKEKYSLLSGCAFDSLVMASKLILKEEIEGKKEGSFFRNNILKQDAKMGANSMVREFDVGEF